MASVDFADGFLRYKNGKSLLAGKYFCTKIYLCINSDLMIMLYFCAYCCVVGVGVCETGNGKWMDSYPVPIVRYPWPNTLPIKHTFGWLTQDPTAVHWFSKNLRPSPPESNIWFGFFGPTLWLKTIYVYKDVFFLTNKPANRHGNFSRMLLYKVCQKRYFLNCWT